MLKDSILETQRLIVDNYVQILVVGGILGFTYLVYRITMRSLGKLKTEILSSYPFDLFIPKGGTWSVGYFLIAILFLGLTIVFLINGKFVFGPA